MYLSISQPLRLPPESVIPDLENTPIFVLFVTDVLVRLSLVSLNIVPSVELDGVRDMY